MVGGWAGGYKSPETDEGYFIGNGRLQLHHKQEEWGFSLCNSGNPRHKDAQEARVWRSTVPRGEEWSG